jgi:hypothetical protein
MDTSSTLLQKPKNSYNVKMEWHILYNDKYVIYISNVVLVRQSGKATIIQTHSRNGGDKKCIQNLVRKLLGKQPFARPHRWVD